MERNGTVPARFVPNVLFGSKALRALASTVTVPPASTAAFPAMWASAWLWKSPTVTAIETPNFTSPVTVSSSFLPLVAFSGLNSVEALEVTSGRFTMRAVTVTNPPA